MAILNLLRNVQFYWFLGHLFAIIFMVLHLLSTLIKGGTNSISISFYNYSINSIIITYLIVIRETYKNKPISFFINKIFTLDLIFNDDNVQYLLLAISIKLYSLIEKINITSSLYPFIIFALFHSLNYIINNKLISNLIVINYIKSFINNYNEKSLFIASNFEVLNLLTYFFKLILDLVNIFRFNLFSNLNLVIFTLILIVFNKIRYDRSKYNKLIVNNYDLKLNTFIYNNNLVPNGIKVNLMNFRNLSINYLQLIKKPTVKKIE
ncbi:hypothetical protein BVG19_g3123 [[Candida] boidinii]|nr:hypothetical protein BVG19_g3123 [[Candida] boidinii]OWB50941.1 hypothetical protein B5S27_g2495 [[Candida] boidinii]